MVVNRAYLHVFTIVDTWGNNKKEDYLENFEYALFLRKMVTWNVPNEELSCHALHSTLRSSKCGAF